MRAFAHFPKQSKCFLCGTNKDTSCTLIGVDETAKDNIEQADPVHISCLKDRKYWRINRQIGVIYGQKSEDKT